MNKQQLAHLETRINNTERYAKAALPQPTRDRWGDEVDVFDEAPEHVRNAVAIKKESERVIERWRKTRKVQYEKAAKTIEAEAKKATTVLLFGDPQKALAAVQAFEKKYGPK